MSRMPEGLEPLQGVFGFSLPPPSTAVIFAPDSQTGAILKYLLDGHSLTPLEALDRFGCFRLGARIWELREAGYDIVSEMVKVGEKRVARYRWSF